MREIKRKFFSVSLALSIMLGTMAGIIMPVYAASAAVQSNITGRIDLQQFTVTSSEAGIYEAYEGGVSIGTGSINANSQTLEFETEGKVTLKVYIGEEGAYELFIGESANMYYADVYMEDEDGVQLDSKTVVLGRDTEIEAEFEAPLTIERDDVVYSCTDNIHVLKYGDSSYTFTYVKNAKEAIDIPVYYVDGQNNTLTSLTVTLNYGEVKSIAAPETYESGGKNYKLKTPSPVEVKYASVPAAYTFEYEEVLPGEKQPYLITMNFVDTDNNKILYATKTTVDVGGAVSIELPTAYYLGYKEYKLQDGTPNRIEREYSSQEDTTYTIPYTLVSDAIAYDITINFVNPGNGNAIIASMTQTIAPDGDPFIYNVGEQATLRVKGKEYLLMDGQGNENGQIVHTFGDNTKVYNIAYRAQDTQVDPSYKVTVKYVDVATNTELYREEKTVAAGVTVSFAQAPKSVAYNDKKFVMINGQKASVKHDYSDLQTNYIIYYRDANEPEDEKATDETVTEIVIQNVTQYITRNDGTIVTDSAGTAVAQVMPVTTVRNEQGETTAMYNEEGTPVAIEDGNITTLPDEREPIVKGKLQGEEVTPESEETETVAEITPAKKKMGTVGAAAIGGLTAITAIAAGLYFWLKRSIS